SDMVRKPQLLHQEQAPANRVVYDLSVEPVSYDFLAWLVTAEMMRIKEGAPPPLVIQFTRDANDDHLHHVDRRERFLHNVLVPACHRLGAAVTAPPNQASRSYNKYTYDEIVRLAKMGESVPKFRASDSARNAMKGYLRKPPVVITLREASYWQHRNSNLTAWLEFGEYLQELGEHVVFVRDTAKADTPLTDFDCCPDASRNLDLRLALYELAKCCIFVSNGPWTLALFSDVPWLMFNKVDALDDFAPNTPRWWQEHHGISPGEQFPWSKGNQRIVWQADDLENLIAAWKDFSGAAEAA